MKAILLGGLAAGILVAVWYGLAADAAAPPSGSIAALVFVGAGIAASVLAILWGVVRLVRLNQNFRLLVSGQALITFLFLVPRIFASGGAGARQPAGLLLLIPIAVVVLAIVRLIRHADELQKRIVLESFAVAFITTLVAVTLAVFGERYGVLPRLPTATWMLVLVISPGIGYLLAARRYRA